MRVSPQIWKDAIQLVDQNGSIQDQRNRHHPEPSLVIFRKTFRWTENCETNRGREVHFSDALISDLNSNDCGFLILD